MTAARGLAWDLGLPLVTYYGLHLLGVGDFAALLATTVASALRVVWVALRDRSLNLFATVMLLVFGIGLALTFVSGDPRFLLLKGSIVTATVSAVFLVTAARGRHLLTLAIDQSWAPSRAQQLAEEYHTDPHVRHRHRVSSAVWGTMLLVEAAVRVPLVYLLPINVMVGLSKALMLTTVVGMIAWRVWYVAQDQRRVQDQNARA